MNMLRKSSAINEMRVISIKPLSHLERSKLMSKTRVQINRNYSLLSQIKMVYRFNYFNTCEFP